MKREILFKAQRADGGGWVEGDLIQRTKPKTYTSIFTNRQIEHKVLPETVCQYTGLKDKNGVKIFEGDKCNTDLGLCAIIWQQHAVKWLGQLQSEGKSYIQFDRNKALKHFEVTGNIHDK